MRISARCEDMELRQLRYFVSIADHGSISRASAVLHIAQPALSNQIRALEGDLGVSLLTRSPQGVSLTDVGKRFYDHAQAILKQAQDARASVGHAANSPAGTVALGIPQSVSGVLALPLLKIARLRYPAITLQLTEETTGNLLEPVRSGRLNLAILFDERQYRLLNAIPLVDEQLIFIASPGAIAEMSLKRLNLHTALSSHLILPDRQNGVRPIIDAAAREASIEIPDIVEINSIAILRSALLADIGVTIGPGSAFFAELTSGLLQGFPIDDCILSRRLMLCSPKNIPVPDAVVAIQALIQTITADLCMSGQWSNAKPVGFEPVVQSLPSAA